MSQKILAKVKFNDGFAYVLSEAPKMVYTKYRTCIIGTDGTFYSCLIYEAPGKGWQAFGGRKFDIELSDGNVEHCHGQWWDGFNAEAFKILGFKPIRVVVQSLERLKECYCFIGDSANPERLNDLVKEYKGIVWEYHDFDSLISKNPYRRRLLTKKKLSRYRNQILKRKSIFKKP